MRRLRTRAILLIAVAGLCPLVLLGLLSIQQARRALRQEVERGKIDLARRAATEIFVDVQKYVDTLRRLSRVVAPTLHLQPEQVHRILTSYALDTPAFRSLVFVDATGHEVGSGRTDRELRDLSSDPAIRSALAGQEYLSPVYITEERNPEIAIALPQVSAGKVVGALMAAVDITEMWNVIDGISVGKRGYARVVGSDGTLIAGGTGELKRRVFSREKDTSAALVNRIVSGEADVVTSYVDPELGEVLAVGQPIPGLRWALILEQPLGEALAPIRSFTAITIALAGVLLALAGFFGFWGARTVVEPIEVLRKRADEIARGMLDQRVEVRSPEELATLAEAMNRMCTDLIRLQDDLRKKERIATLGRLAAGLAHDLKHPIKALQANAQLVIDYPEDAKARRIFTDSVAREFKRVDRLLDDLKRASRNEPMEIHRDWLDVSRVVTEFAEELRHGIAPAGVEILVEDHAGGAAILASRDLLERVLSNLASNAFEAMEGEGKLTLTASADRGEVELRVADTGGGIPPERIQGLFNDFATTKPRGLGLGLVVCRRIITDHGGTIEVDSAVGIGTEFCIRLQSAPPPLAAAAATVDRSRLS